MMGNISFGLGLLCAAMMAIMCVPMIIGMIRRRWRREHTNTTPAPAGQHVADHTTAGTQAADR